MPTKHPKQAGMIRDVQRNYPDAHAVKVLGNDHTDAIMSGAITLGIGSKPSHAWRAAWIRFGREL